MALCCGRPSRRPPLAGPQDEVCPRGEICEPSWWGARRRRASRTMRAPACAPKSQSKRAAGCPAALIKSLREEAYFRLLIAVRSKDSLAMPAAPHQLEPTPDGLIAVTKVPVEAVRLPRAA